MPNLHPLLEHIWGVGVGGGQLCYSLGLLVLLFDVLAFLTHKASLADHSTAPPYRFQTVVEEHCCFQNCDPTRRAPPLSHRKPDRLALVFCNANSRLLQQRAGTIRICCWDSTESHSHPTGYRLCLPPPSQPILTLLTSPWLKMAPCPLSSVLQFVCGNAETCGPSPERRHQLFYPTGFFRTSLLMVLPCVRTGFLPHFLSLTCREH